MQHESNSGKSIHYYNLGKRTRDLTKVQLEIVTLRNKTKPKQNVTLLRTQIVIYTHNLKIQPFEEQSL